MSENKQKTDTPIRFGSTHLVEYAAEDCEHQNDYRTQIALCDSHRLIRVVAGMVLMTSDDYRFEYVHHILSAWIGNWIDAVE